MYAGEKTQTVLSADARNTLMRNTKRVYAGNVYSPWP